MIRLTYDPFDPGALLVLDGAAHEVEWSRESQPGLVIKLQGIENRTVAELFRGRYLEVPDEAKRTLEDGRYYYNQVVGLEVVNESGEPTVNVLAVGWAITVVLASRHTNTALTTCFMG